MDFHNHNYRNISHFQTNSSFFPNNWIYFPPSTIHLKIERSSNNPWPSFYSDIQLFFHCDYFIYSTPTLNELLIQRFRLTILINPQIFRHRSVKCVCNSMLISLLLHFHLIHTMHILRMLVFLCPGYAARVLSITFHPLNWLPILLCNYACNNKFSLYQWTNTLFFVSYYHKKNTVVKRYFSGDLLRDVK